MPLYIGIFNQCYYFSIKTYFLLRKNSFFYVMFKCFTFIHFLLLGLGGIYCGIYKSSYNISYLSSPLPSFFFIPLHSWKSFNRFIFHLHMEMCTNYLHYIHPPMSSPLTPSIHPSNQDLFFVFVKIKTDDIFVSVI
jgi:hypothetical protein